MHAGAYHDAGHAVQHHPDVVGAEAVDVEGEDAAPETGLSGTDDVESADVLEGRAHALHQRCVPTLDLVHADPRQVLDGRLRAYDPRVVLQAGLEPVRHRGQVDRVVRRQTDGPATQLQGADPLESLAVPVHDAHPGRSKHLVDGEAVDVGPQPPQVHGHVRGGLRPVDYHRGAVVVGDLGDRPHGDGAPSDVPGVLDGDDLDVVVHAPVEGFEVERAVLAGPGHPAPYPDGLLEVEPRDVIGVVLRVRRDDHVPPLEGDAVGGRVQGPGAVAGEDVAIWVLRAEEPGQGLTRLVDLDRDAGRHRMDAATAARGIVLVVLGDCTDDLIGPQGLTCAVKIDPLPVANSREVPANPFHVHALAMGFHVIRPGYVAVDRMSVRIRHLYSGPALNLGHGIAEHPRRDAGPREARHGRVRDHGRDGAVSRPHDGLRVRSGRHEIDRDRAQRGTRQPLLHRGGRGVRERDGPPQPGHRGVRCRYGGGREGRTRHRVHLRRDPRGLL